MTLDLILAIAHHLLVIGLVVMMATELARLRPGLTGANLTGLARLDAGYGAVAGLTLAVGALRAIYGVKGWSYYQANPWFWAKMAAFAAIGLLSIPPTLAFLRWRRSQAGDPGFSPSDADIARTRGYLVWEVGLLLVVVACAAAMARLG